MKFRIEKYPSGQQSILDTREIVAKLEFATRAEAEQYMVKLFREELGLRPQRFLHFSAQRIEEERAQPHPRVGFSKPGFYSVLVAGQVHLVLADDQTGVGIFVVERNRWELVEELEPERP